MTRETKIVQPNLAAYLPALDGLRAISILLVFITHLFLNGGILPNVSIPGSFGVTVFFFISGFLITRLLLSEQKKHNQINVKKFYIRRVLRLYPPLLTMLLLTVGYLWLVHNILPLQEILAALFYFENYFITLYHTKGQNYFDVFWSLAVEEHFYLFYPLIFLLFRKKPRQLLIVVSALIVIPLLIRVFVSYQFNSNEFSYRYTYALTQCRFDSILYGCLSALILNTSYGDWYIRIASKKWFYFFAVLLIVFTFGYRSEFFRQTFRFTIQGIALMIVIPPILFNLSYAFLNKILSSSGMVYIGKLSYSIYLFHFLVIDILGFYSFTNKITYVIVNVLMSALFSIASYRFIEQPFFRLRKRFGSHVQKETLVPLQQVNTA